MKRNTIMGVLYQSGLWLARMMLLQLLWFVFTILGLGVLGFFPALAAVSNIIYTWFNRHVDIKINKNFFSFYKKNFVKSNLTGWIITFFIYFLYMDLKISQIYIQIPLLHYLIIIIILIVITIAVYIFTIQSRYELTILNSFKQSFFISMSSPKETIGILISIVIIFYFYSYFPFMAVLMGIPFVMIPVVWLSYRACKKIEKKRLNE